MSRTYRRTKRVEPWVFSSYEKKELWKYFSDRSKSWNVPWSHCLKEESNSKARSHFKQEISKFHKNNCYEICLNKKYGNPWNWD